MMLSNVMENYFNSEKVIKESNDQYSPVKIKKSQWITTKNKLQRSFYFEKRKFKEAFIVEILKYCRETSCDLQFYVSKEEVVVFINSISPYLTELEIECSKDVMKIKKDIMYYYEE